MKFLISIPKLVDPASSRTSHSGCSLLSPLLSPSNHVLLSQRSTDSATLCFMSIYSLLAGVCLNHSWILFHHLSCLQPLFSQLRVCLPKHTPYSVFLHITEMFIPWCLLVEWTNHVVPHKREVDRMWSTFNRILFGTKGIQPVLERYHGSHLI
jgi:hypothetical protein